jgi:hypothetical protein
MSLTSHSEGYRSDEQARNAIVNAQRSAVTARRQVALRRRFASRYTEFLERFSEAVPAAVLARALAAPDERSGLAVALAETVEIPPARDPLARAKARSQEVRRLLLEEAGGAYEVSEVAQLLGVTPAAVHQRRQRATLLAIRAANGQWLYPAFQFDPPELASQIGRVLSAFRVTEPWTKLSVLLSGAPSLGSRRPIDALRDGDVEGAIEAVAAYGLDDADAPAA